MKQDKQFITARDKAKKRPNRDKKFDLVKTQDEKFISVRERVKKYVKFIDYICNESTYYKMMGVYNAKKDPPLNKMDIQKLKSVMKKAREDSRKTIQDFIDNHDKAFTDFENELDRLDL